jgi:hypothetical protein
MTAAAPLANRRAHVRRQPAVGTVFRLAESPGVPAGLGLVWNLSNGGVSLLTSAPIAPGTHVHGDLTTMSGTQNLPIGFSVTHMAKLQTGDYCIGGRFDAALADEQMKSFLG